MSVKSVCVCVCVCVWMPHVNAPPPDHVTGPNNKVARLAKCRDQHHVPHRQTNPGRSKCNFSRSRRTADGRRRADAGWVLGRQPKPLFTGAVGTVLHSPADVW